MSNTYLILYILAWLITFLVYQRKHQQLDAGSVIIVSYIGFAICSLILFNSPVRYYRFNELTLFPFMYLFIMLLIALSPVLRFNSKLATSIAPPNITIFNAISWIVIISAILSIPALIEQLLNGQFLMLFADETAGHDMYLESIDNAEDAGSGIAHIPNIIFNAFSDVTILLFFYALTMPKRNKLMTYGLGLALIVALISPLLSGLRTQTTITVFSMIVAYFLVRPYLSQSVKHIARAFGIFVLVISFIPIAAITISRFGNRDGGAQSSVLFYAGQANLNFNNYGLDNNGIRYGDRTFNIVKRLYDPNTPSNYIERRDKYPHLYIDDYYFYTFVGDFTLDFGPWIAALIIICFSIYVNRRTKIYNDKIAFHQLILIFLVACICVQGGMYLFSYSDTAGLKLIVFILLYYIFRLTHREPIEESNN